MATALRPMRLRLPKHGGSVKAVAGECPEMTKTTAESSVNASTHMMNQSSGIAKVVPKGTAVGSEITTTEPANVGGHQPQNGRGSSDQVSTHDLAA